MNAQIRITRALTYSLTVADEKTFAAKYKSWVARQILNRNKIDFLAALATRFDRSELSKEELKTYGVTIYIKDADMKLKKMKSYNG